LSGGGGGGGVLATAAAAAAASLGRKGGLHRVGSERERESLLSAGAADGDEAAQGGGAAVHVRFDSGDNR
jgi:hypothetical protein